MQEEDKRELLYVPKTDEAAIWAGLKLLFGCDLPGDAPDTYIFSRDDLREMFEDAGLLTSSKKLSEQGTNRGTWE